ETLAEAITQKVHERADYQGLDRHLIFKVTEEGLRIEVVDRDGAPMFESGVADATPRMQALLQVIAEVLAETPNKVALTGHTDAIPFASGSRYGNWELSTDRAQAARRLLERSGIAPDRIQRVEGLADTVPLITDNPDDPRNRRIGIVVLRGDR
ncbi:MAG: OmpA family protein, partial [Alphaproteobacteria bacterium]|nr:OmpA family protein [Alphaproteobacteria bacterium]